MLINEVKKILDTLPIGYYLKRKINVQLDDQTPTSYYDPIHNLIVVSANNFSENGVNEKNVRAMLYHEVSHAMLTNANVLTYLRNNGQYSSSFTIYDYDNLDYNLKNEIVSKMHEIINVFEDERIETVNRKLFYNVDFKQNVYLVNETTPAEVASKYYTLDTFNRFYSVVRFNIGDPEDIKEVYKIIKKWSKLNSVGSVWTNNKYYHYNTHFSCWCDYIKDITELYIKLYKKLQQQISQSQNQTNQTQDNQTQDNQNDQTKNEQSKDDQGQSQSQSQAAETSQDNQTQNDIDQFIQELTELITGSELDFEEVSKEVFEETYDKKLSETIKNIFDNASKKQILNGYGSRGYSGHFNPRNIAKHESLERYKWWDKNNGNDSGKNKKIKLNLWIDISGSMCNSIIKVNKLLNSIVNANQKSFNYDIVTINSKTTLLNDIHKLVANGGTRIGENVFDIYKKINRFDDKNVNIVMFDGSCSYPERSRVWDHSNCIVITDPGNECFKDYIKSGKVIISQDYTEELIKNVIESLEALLK